MDHVAIMKKSWGLLEKIRSGEKRIESRWSVNRCIPWGRIKPGDRIYFKNSGEPVRLKATIAKVSSFTRLTPRRVGVILKKYGRLDGIDPKDRPKFYRLFKRKKYCQLIYLNNPKDVRRFQINKRGFGTMSAWLAVKNIDTIKT